MGGVSAHQIANARDDFVRWRRLKKGKEGPSTYDKVITTIVPSDGSAKSILRLRIQLYINRKDILVRLYDPMLFFKHDTQISFL